MSVNLVVQAFIPEEIFLQNKEALEKQEAIQLEELDEHYEYVLKAHIPESMLKNADGSYKQAKIISVGYFGSMSDFFWTEQLEYSQWPELEGRISRIAWIDFYHWPEEDKVSRPIRISSFSKYVTGIERTIKAKKYTDLREAFLKTNSRAFCELAKKYGYRQRLYWSTC